MGITAVWDDEEHTIVRYKAEGQWQWRDFRPVIDEAVKMIEGVDHRVDVIADLRHSALLPINAFPTLKYMAAVTPENAARGTFTVVGGGAFVKVLGTAFSRAYMGLGVPPYFTDTLEEAYAFVAEQRERDG